MKARAGRPRSSRRDAGATVHRRQVSDHPAGFSGRVAAKPGALRSLVACSNANAILMSVGSLHARPKNEIPTGMPWTNPAGTLRFGYPATAAALELPPVK